MHSYREQNSVDMFNSSETKNVMKLQKKREDLDVFDQQHTICRTDRNIWSWMIKSRKSFRKSKDFTFNKRYKK
jgi:5-bromo-4-chloroindolyl phosphate hydrolysis protein